MYYVTFKKFAVLFSFKIFVVTLVLFYKNPNQNPNTPTSPKKKPQAPTSPKPQQTPRTNAGSFPRCGG